jgi:hypothetical protein
MLCYVALLRTYVSEERIASIIRVTRVGELATTLAVTDNHVHVLRLLVADNVIPRSPTLLTLMMEAIRSYETLVCTRFTRCNMPKDGILLEKLSSALQMSPKDNLISVALKLTSSNHMT